MKIVAVIVTFNRLEKLKNTLTSYEGQIYPFDDIIVVDNHSSDGTERYLDDWKHTVGKTRRHVITLPENVGGSGGFYAGEVYAMSLAPDWISVGDDDAYPDSSYLHNFIDFIDSHSDEKIAAVASRVELKEGSIDFGHRTTLIRKPCWGYPRIYSKAQDYLKDFFEIDMFSYVGTIMNVKAIEQFGFCNKDLFIYADDADHSLRLSKYGKIYCFPTMKVLHDSGQAIDKKTSSLSWRDYYSYRNQIFLFKKYNIRATLFIIVLGLKQGALSNLQGFKLCIRAIFAGLFGKLGIHKLYKPGFVIK